jgi:hypothetical protein
VPHPHDFPASVMPARRAGASPDTTVPFSAGLIQELYRGPMGMNRAFKAAVAALILAFRFAGSVAAGPIEDAGAAYTKGDYATTLRLLRPLAEQGDAMVLCAATAELARGHQLAAHPADAGVLSAD